MKAGLRLVVILFVVCGAAAGSLALVNAATRERIARYAGIARTQALKAVDAGADGFVETVPGKAWDAMKGGQKIGSVRLTSIQGYSGPIEVVFGVDLEGAVTGVRVLSHTETPGLGAKIATSRFLDQYVGKTRDGAALRKDDPAGAIDAIAGATISSRAVTRAVREAMDAARAPASGGD